MLYSISQPSRCGWLDNLNAWDSNDNAKGSSTAAATGWSGSAAAEGGEAVDGGSTPPCPASPATRKPPTVAAALPPPAEPGAATRPAGGGWRGHQRCQWPRNLKARPPGWGSQSGWMAAVSRCLSDRHPELEGSMSAEATALETLRPGRQVIVTWTRKPGR